VKRIKARTSNGFYSDSKVSTLTVIDTVNQSSSCSLMSEKRIFGLVFWNSASRFAYEGDAKWYSVI